MLTFEINPIIIKLVSKELPPALIKGSVIPATGASRIVIPIFWKIENDNAEKYPIQISLPKISLDCIEVFNILTSRIT